MERRAIALMAWINAIAIATYLLSTPIVYFPVENAVRHLADKIEQDEGRIEDIDATIELLNSVANAYEIERRMNIGSYAVVVSTIGTVVIGFGLLISTKKRKAEPGV